MPTTLPPLIRESGRWVKRSRLRALRALSTEKARYNTLLNQREIWQGRTRLDSFPRMIQVGTNWTCNLHCFFCRRETTDKERLAALAKNELEISDSTLDQLMKVLPYAEVFTLTPLGEPLMWSGLPRLLERLQKLDCRNLHLTTNGNITTEKRAQRLVESGVRRVYVSIDSHDPKTYAEMRVAGDLNKVTEGLQLLREWKTRLKSELPEIVIASTFMRRNIEHLPGLVRYAHANGVNFVAAQLMEDEDAGIEAETLKHYIPLTVQSMREAVRVAAELGVYLNIHLALKNLISRHAMEIGAAELLRDMPQLDTRKTTLMEKCVYPWTFMVVDTDSDCRPCCWAGTSFGNMAQRPFEEIWNGETALRMRADFLRNHIPTSCREKHCRVDL